MRAKQPLILLLLMLLANAWPAAAQPEAPVSRKSALDRRGVHHADISGRLVSRGGDPVPGVRLRLTSGGPASLPFRQTVSGTDGRFAFVDVNCPFTAILLWQPPERWSPGGTGIEAEHFGTLDLGEIELVPDTTLRLAVELVGGEPLREDLSEALSIELQEPSSDKTRGARKLGDSWVFRDIPFDSARWDISIDTKPTERFDGEVRIEKGRRDQLLLLRLRRDRLQSDDSGELKGPVETTEILAPETPFQRDAFASGKIAGPDGSAIGGALVGAAELLRDMVPAYAVTDETGKFELHYPADRCRGLTVSYLRARDAFPLGKVDEESCEEYRMSGPTVTVPSGLQLQFEVEGVKPEVVRAFWWHRDLGWIRFFTLRPWLSPSAYSSARIRVKLETSSYLPILRDMTVPSLPDLKQQAQNPIGSKFSFDPDVTRELVLLGGGKPIEGATVDVESILDLSRDRRAPLGTYQTDSAGRLRLSGGGDALVEIFVGAPGFEPARAIWEPGRPMTLELAPRASRLVFPGLRAGSVARLYRVGEWPAAHTLRANYGPIRSIDVSAGDYDVVVHDATGAVVGYRRVSAKAGEKLDFDITVDQRPRLIVRYPEPGWSSSVSHSTPASAPSGWSAYSVLGPTEAANVAAQLESESAREAAFRLSRGGRFHIEVRRRGQQRTLWREIDIPPGETVSLDLPKTEAVLRGSMNTYSGDTGFSIHGWAGPRLQLISDDPSGWSVTVAHPHREKDMTFTIPGLPSGNYHLYQHLIGSRETRQSSGHEYEYTTPIDAWGGIPVALQPDQTTVLPDFIEYPYKDLLVTILDRHGEPLRGATLRIRDRMSEAWRQVAEGPTTLAFASDPIPYPPAVRLENGRATLPSIRAGQLEMLIEFDDGRLQPLVAEVDPDKTLILRIPAGDGR